MLVAKTTLVCKSLCCRTPLPFQGLELQLEATNFVSPNRAGRSGCPSWTFPQKAVAKTDAGQTRLDLTQETWKANKHHLVTGPHTGS